MKMKKLMMLGIIAPVFAMSVSCSKGARRISFDEAFNFAIENYDQYYHLGYEPTYILKLNEASIIDTNLYKQVVKQDSRSYEKVYFIDTTIKDLATTIDTDELTIPHINSVAVREIAHYLSMADALLGYFEYYFTLEDNKYLGVYVGSEKLGQVLNIFSGVLAILGLITKEVPQILQLFDYLSCVDAVIDVSAQCNNLGLIDRAHLLLEINGLSFSVSNAGKEFIKNILPIDFGVGTSKSIVLDLDFIVDYSNK